MHQEDLSISAEEACILIFKKSTLGEIVNYSNSVKLAWEIGKELSKEKPEKCKGCVYEYLSSDCGDFVGNCIYE